MKARLLAVFALMLLGVLVGCGGGAAGTSTTVENSTGAIVTSTAPAPKTTTPPGKVPPPAELAKQNFELPNIPRISAEELFVVYDNREPLTLVDVRSKELHDSGYIPGSSNIPNVPEADSTRKLISLIESLGKDRLIVLYCD